MISSLVWPRSNSSASKISCTFRRTVVSSLPVRFLMSCWVMVLPPWTFCPVNIYLTAAAVRRQSTPWWDQKRLSSMDTVASIRFWGMSSRETHTRFSEAYRVCEAV